MNNDFLALLLELFEQDYKELLSDINTSAILEESSDDEQNASTMLDMDNPKENSTRVLHELERVRLSPASYQYLARLKKLNIIDAKIMEQILNQLLFSNEDFIYLDELKWAVRQILTLNKDKFHPAFLDLVLYHTEYDIKLH